jgi:hypothetical protein
MVRFLLSEGVMRSVALLLLGLALAGVSIAPAAGQAWLRVGDAEGHFRLDMPVPFDQPDPEISPDGVVTSVYAHAASDLTLRFEIIDLVRSVAPDAFGDAEHGPSRALAATILVSRSDHRLGAVEGRAYVLRFEDGALVHQERLYRVGNRLYRVLAISTPEREDDPLIHRFLESLRLLN